MQLDRTIGEAIKKGACLYASVSGGKDGQAMVKTLVTAGYTLEGLIHADLGRVEWQESSVMCQRLREEFSLPLHIVCRHDGRDLLDHWEHRLQQLAGSGKPFWSSSKSRYCTSDMKREPINKFFRHCGHDFLVSCEGVRAEESTARARKCSLQIRWDITSSYYDGMSVEQAIVHYQPGKRLALTWYPVFHFTLSDVWATYGMNQELLKMAREHYTKTNVIPGWWPFHPAYAYGNDRVSCVFCVLASRNDLNNGARHRPELLGQMIDMEQRGAATFKHHFSLKQLLPPIKNE